jgi:hypothetical protein
MASIGGAIWGLPAMLFRHPWKEKEERRYMFGYQTIKRRQDLEIAS